MSKIKKFSTTIDGHRTSISLEPVFWEKLKELAKYRRTTISQLISKIDSQSEGNLSSAIRVFILKEIDSQ